ncbi:Cytochrome P450 CYP2 subfamily [Handroanthus impetiginosus]|uniref:Cytochrome P450 CYP2 subfamily n=1 Tax=Handroanthus impetiginosus TaxID=429701 RepID=A0A2G9H6Q9_9LAMI|nr:Cytochrome P450 CYP2 subfamily [Handroanthus impetiginosus]
MEITIPSQFHYVLFFFLFFFVKISLKKNKNSAKNTQLPPSPPSLPIIGHLHLLSSTLHISFKNLASSYGPFMLICAGRATQYIVSNGAIAKEIFKTHDINFAARPEFGSSDYQIYKETLFSTLDYSKYWIFLKKICMMEILSTQQISRFVGFRKEERIKLLEVITGKAENGEACDLGFELMVMTNNLICRMIMSTRCSGDANEGMEIREVAKGITLLSGLLSLGEAFSLFKKYDLFGAGRKVKALLMRFDALMDGIILKHEKERENGERKRKDMMDILLSICEDSEAEVKLTKMGIKGLFLDLFLGGTDTTSVALQWAMAELLNHPSSLKKLQDEIDTTVGLNKLVDESDIPNLPYLQAVVKETLRLHPSLPLVFRKCREDCKINNYPIAKDSRIVVNLYAINRDPDAWENAADFVPERFLVNSINAISHDDPENMKGQNFSYVPFGGGRRGCPGAALATAVVHVTLAGLIQCFDWKIKGDEKVNMEEGAGFSAAMAHTLVCFPVLRVDPAILS